MKDRDSINALPKGVEQHWWAAKLTLLSFQHTTAQAAQYCTVQLLGQAVAPTTMAAATAEVTGQAAASAGAPKSFAAACAGFTGPASGRSLVVSSQAPGEGSSDPHL